MSEMYFEVTSSSSLGDGSYIEQTRSYWVPTSDQPWIFDIPREAEQLDDDE